MKITAADVDTLARTNYGEARGEGIEGMRMVSWIVRRRWTRGGFGQTLLEVAASRDFSCWHPGNANHRAMLRADLADPLFRLALVAATEVIHGLVEDPTRGALYYKVVGHPSSWFRHALEGHVIEPTLTADGEHLRIGNHELYSPGEEHSG